MVAFNADEVFEIAEQIERNGAKFYQKAAAGVETGAAALLKKLAAMEVDHQKTFAAMRAGLPADLRRPTTPDADDEAGMYLRAVADGKIFDITADPSEKLTGKETLEEILRTAISLEKESVVFYTGIRQKMDEDLGRDKIESIIREEMSHITILSEQLAAVAG